MNAIARTFDQCSKISRITLQKTHGIVNLIY